MISHAPKKLAKLPRHRDQPMSLKVVGAYSFLRTTRRYQPFILLGFDNSHPTIFRHWDSQVFPSQDFVSSGITSLYRSRAFAEQFGSANLIKHNLAQNPSLDLHSLLRVFPRNIDMTGKSSPLFPTTKTQEKKWNKIHPAVRNKDTSDSTQLSVGNCVNKKSQLDLPVWHLESPWNKPPVAFASVRCEIWNLGFLDPCFHSFLGVKKKSSNGYPPTTKK